MIKLYGQLRSRASRSVWLLEEIGVPYELVPIDTNQGDNDKPAFLAINSRALSQYPELGRYVLQSAGAPEAMGRGLALQLPELGDDPTLELHAAAQ